MFRSLSKLPGLSPIAGLVLMTAITCCSDAAPVGPYAISKTFDVDGMGNVRMEWHNHVLGPLTIDPRTHRLYLTRTTDTAVLDGTTGRLLADMHGMKWARGVALAPRIGRGFISDEGVSLVPRPDGRGLLQQPHGSRIFIFNPQTNAVLGSIAVPDGAGSIIYDPASDRVVVACTAGGGKLVFFRPDIKINSAPDSAPVDLGGAPIALAVDGAGSIYASLSDDTVAVVDIEQMKVRSRFPVAPGKRPFGLAVDPARHYLFISCRNQQLIIMSAQDGRVIATFQIGRADGYNYSCGFDSDTGNILAAGEELTVIKETSAEKFQVIQQLTLGTMGTFMALDTATHTLYFPSTHFFPNAPKSDIVVVSPRPR